MYRTERLVLREWNDDDVVPFSAMCADEAVMRFFPSTMNSMESAQFVKREQDRMKTDGFGLWVLDIGGQFGGFVGLARVSFQATFAPCIEIGWRLPQWAWGHGYASEAAREAVRVGFKEHNFDCIYSFTTALNAPSEGVMKRIGMNRRAELDFDHPNTPNWAGQRHIVYSIDPPVQG